MTLDCTHLYINPPNGKTQCGLEVPFPGDFQVVYGSLRELCLYVTRNESRVCEHCAGVLALKQLDEIEL